MPFPTDPPLILNLPWGTLGVYYSGEGNLTTGQGTVDIYMGYPGCLRYMEATMPREAARFSIRELWPLPS